MNGARTKKVVKFISTLNIGSLTTPLRMSCASVIDKIVNVLVLASVGVSENIGINIENVNRSWKAVDLE